MCKAQKDTAIATTQEAMALLRQCSRQMVEEWPNDDFTAMWKVWDQLWRVRQYLSELRN